MCGDLKALRMLKCLMSGGFTSRFVLGRASSSFQAEEGVVMVLGKEMISMTFT